MIFGFPQLKFWLDFFHFWGEKSSTLGGTLHRENFSSPSTRADFAFEHFAHTTPYKSLLLTHFTTTYIILLLAFYAVKSLSAKSSPSTLLIPLSPLATCKRSPLCSFSAAIGCFQSAQIARSWTPTTCSNHRSFNPSNLPKNTPTATKLTRRKTQQHTRKSLWMPLQVLANR